MPRTLIVCRVDELPPGGRRIVEDDGRGIGVFNFEGGFRDAQPLPAHGRPAVPGRVGGAMSPTAPTPSPHGLRAR